jgi:hypothetical protein
MAAFGHGVIRHVAGYGAKARLTRPTGYRLELFARMLNSACASLPSDTIFAR